MPWLLTRKGLLNKYNSELEKWCRENLEYKKNNQFKKRDLPPLTAVLWKIYFIKSAKLKVIAVPRMTPHILKTNFDIKDKLPLIDNINISSSIILRPAQKKCLNIIVNKLRTTGGATLQINVGKGKSFIAAKLIEEMKLPTLYVCHNILSLEQFVDKIYPTYSNPELLGVYYGKKKKKAPITIAVINSIMKLPKTWFAQFGLIIVDEVTEMISELRRKVFWNMNSKYMLGMTATPHEKPMRFDIIYELHCGPIFNGNYLFANEVEDPCTVHALKYRGPEMYTQHIYVNESVSVMKMHAQFSKDPYRNALIIREVLRLAEAGKPTYIFSVITNALHELEKVLKKYNYPIYMLTGERKDLDPKELNKLTGVFIVLTTYKCGSIGLSINAMRAAVFANSMMSNMRQTFGRIFRELTGENREIIDIIDHKTSIGSQYHRARAKLYRKKNFKILEKKIDYKDIDVDILYK